MFENLYVRRALYTNYAGSKFYANISFMSYTP